MRANLVEIWEQTLPDFSNIGCHTDVMKHLPHFLLMHGAAVLLMSSALAQAPSGSSNPPSKPPSPPPEAIAACAGKTDGAPVSFKGRNGETLSGTCNLVEGVLAARPAGGPGGKNGPPPPAK